MDIYETRAQRTNPYLKGHGVEIGAGANPQAVPPGVTVTYADLRSAEELNKYFGLDLDTSVVPVSSLRRHFPRGADFLIAHHVIEHSVDPIGQLRRWHELIVAGGVLVISAPHHLQCPDKHRLVPTLEHLVLDHLLRRTEDAFESREHIVSFLVSWIDNSPGLEGLTSGDACRKILREARKVGHDLHWHAFTPTLLRDLVVVASTLDGYVPEFKVDAEDYDGSIDILAVYQLATAAPNALNPAVLKRLEFLKSKLLEAADALPGPTAFKVNRSGPT